jgi:hypothetical protein
MDVRDTEGGTGLESTSEKRVEGGIHSSVYLHPSRKMCQNSSLVDLICIVSYPVIMVYTASVCCGCRNQRDEIF